MYEDSKFKDLETECYKKTNFLKLNKKSMVYFTHILFSIALVYILLVNKNTRNIMPLSLNIFFLIIVAFIFLQVQMFEDILPEAQKCAGPNDPNIPWGDGQTRWYKNIFFFFVWIFSLFYGLHIFSSGSLMNFEPGFSEILLNNKTFRSLCVLPLLGFLYSFGFIYVSKGNVVKPIASRHAKWERPIAIYFTMVFIPFLLIAIYGSKILDKENILYKIFTNRIVVGVFLFATMYFIVWRLNGGLFLNKKKNDELQAALKKYMENKK